MGAIRRKGEGEEIKPANSVNRPMNASAPDVQQEFLAAADWMQPNWMGLV
jgi:hypothetical protein